MSERAAKVSKKVPAQKAGSDSATKIKPPTGKTTRIKRGTVKVPKGRATKGARSVQKKDEQELEPITPFKRGLGLGVKFAGLTAAVVGAFMFLLGYLTYSITAQRMDDQITEQGVSIVSALEKALDRGFWLGREEVVHHDPNDPDHKNKPQPIPQKTREQLTADWQKRFEGIVQDSGEKIVAISLTEQVSGKPYLVLQYPESTQLAIENPVERGTVDDIKITECYLRGERVRRFQKPISLEELTRETELDKLLDTVYTTDPEEDVHKQALQSLTSLTGTRIADAQTAQQWRDDNPRYIAVSDGTPEAVSVFVKASRLDEVKSALWQRILFVTGCGAVAGMLLTTFIAAWLTAPVRMLEQDITEVAGGNLDHQSSVRSSDEMGALAHVFNIMTRNLRIAQGNAVERKAFERELNIAKEIQEKLLPERIPQIPGFDIHSHYNAAKEVGGDYYDFIVIDATHLGIIVADVAGKGIPGAMVMTMARSLVRLASVRNVSPADTFKKVNRILAKDIRRGMFVTAAYMVLNVKTRALRVASAGHNPVVLFRAKTGENELIKPAGIALGFDKGTIFDNHIQEVEVQLEPGDRIVTYTDGVNEAMNNDSEEFGDDRFFDLVKQHAKKSSKDFVEAVVRALEQHRGSAEQSDDITITTLSVTGEGGADA